jgi:hypothetical protein
MSRRCSNGGDAYATWPTRIELKIGRVEENYGQPDLLNRQTDQPQVGHASGFWLAIDVPTPEPGSPLGGSSQSVSESV